MRKPPQPRSLGVLFDELSRSHFAGRLGGYSVRRQPLRASAKTALGMMRRKAPMRLAVTVLARRQIRVSGVLQFHPVLERRVLLHEMCHVATEDEAMQTGQHHGPEWCAEMSRLAREHGETWAAREAKRYEPGGERCPA